MSKKLGEVQDAIWQVIHQD